AGFAGACLSRHCRIARHPVRGLYDGWLEWILPHRYELGYFPLAAGQGASLAPLSMAAKLRERDTAQHASIKRHFSRRHFQPNPLARLGERSEVPLAGRAHLAARDLVLAPKGTMF